jgi:hypothetical protein
MRRNFLPLITHLIREISREDAMGARGLLAFQFYGESASGQIDRKRFDQTVKTLEEMSMLEYGMVLSCGLTANTFCQIFTGRAQLAHTCSLAELKELVKDRQARIIRVDLQGHAYVIEQTDTAHTWRKPQGNVYQSNVAVIGNSALGITLKKYLDENPNPVDLEGYLGQLAVVSSATAPAQDRLDLYKKMYTAPSYLKNPQVKPITEQAIAEASASLEVKTLSYQDFEERDVLRGVNAILSAYRNIRGTSEARDIYFTRCWV